MRYRLIVVTHGAGAQLDRVLASFDENVSPAPTERVLIVDGPGRIPDGLGDWTIWAMAQQKGFCMTYQRAWLAAQETELPYVFLLENDFVFKRPVDLEDLALVLGRHPRLAQMVLLRQAVNEKEKVAGGLVESRPGEFEQVRDSVLGREPLEWLRHRSFWSTNVCLFPAQLARDHPWPDVAQHCEGVYGIQLKEAGYEFGMWGDGTPWIEHVGVRDGFGY